ncbi:hypothetical protein QJS04_geneDACA023670 [Acorus gramineus]|uniref:NADH dehydrogenase subunit 6 n=1 Tax=Acorus gramineus TaxID=55184 RepID=A0AAV9A032_ACOGR|nr:hypothetical protein QJS04_geneDACA023670 [Acorus gramineus]
MAFPLLFPKPSPTTTTKALIKFALWFISLSTAALLNLPMSPPQIPASGIFLIIYSVIVYAAFVVGLCLLSVSLLRRTAPPSPSPSPNRRHTPPREAVLGLAIWAIAISAGALFNLPTATMETLFGEVLVMVYALTMFLTFNMGLVLLCLNQRKQCPVSTPCNCS